uniref:Gag-Pol polyprotein n=1 Tax=Tanacetum cinerariifolium TaxID=118510 RepID=A0A699HSU8_TANCI|nr:Gag-Pol polyprotein [Tanacetum cinerariifolium]
MELAVEQHYAEKTKFQTQMENVLKENDRLLTQALSVEIVNIVVHDCMNVDCLTVDACVHCVTTESELKTNFIKKECYETLLQQCHILETHCISLEVNNQLNKEIFQRDTVSSPESAPTFAELFEINDLKAQVQEKDTVILILKAKLKSFSGDVKERKVKREVEEIETLNLELDHKVTKLAAENEHLKQTYKQLFDSIKNSRVQSKEHCDDLITKVNLKSVETYKQLFDSIKNSRVQLKEHCDDLITKVNLKSVEVLDLNASLQEKVLVITALKEQINKLKSKAVLTDAISLNPIDPALLQVDVASLVPKLYKNRTAHTDYIRHTQEEAATLREIVESERLLMQTLGSGISIPLAVGTLSTSSGNLYYQWELSPSSGNALSGCKDRPPMLEPGNYVQWKSRIKRYIDTKPNHELIHYCLMNPPYKFTWADKEVPISKGIDNDIYSTVDACPNACEMWKAIERLNRVNQSMSKILKPIYIGNLENLHHRMSQELKTVSYHKLYNILKQHQNEVIEIRAKRIARTANPLALVAQQQPVYHPQNHPTHYTRNSSTISQQAATKNKGKAIVNSPPPIYDQEPSMVAEDDEM